MIFSKGLLNILWPIFAPFPINGKTYRDVLEDPSEGRTEIFLSRGFGGFHRSGPIFRVINVGYQILRESILLTLSCLKRYMFLNSLPLLRIKQSAPYPCESKLLGGKYFPELKFN
jgi:hypothetical protein